MKENKWKKLMVLNRWITFILLSIFFNETVTYAETSNALNLIKGQVVCIPIYVESSETEIIGADIIIQYSSRMFDIHKISLKGGFLEKYYSLTIGKQINDKISLGIYASSGTCKGSGIIANIYLVCKNNDIEQSKISIQKYLINDQNASGGMLWGDLYNQLNFVSRSSSLHDVINSLQILSGFQSKNRLYDLTGDNRLEINDILQLLLLLTY